MVLIQDTIYINYWNNIYAQKMELHLYTKIDADENVFNVKVY